MRLSPFSGHTIHRLHSSRVPFGRLHGQRPRQSGFSNRSDLAEMALNLSMLVSVQQPERSSDSRGSKAISRTQSYASPEYWHGRGDGVTIEYSSASVINALRDMATSSRREAHRLGDRFGGGDNNHFFFRFNVGQGLRHITLSDREVASKISAHTRNYLAEDQRAIRRFVDSFSGNVSAGGDGRNSTTGRVHFAVPFGRTGISSAES